MKKILVAISIMAIAGAAYACCGGPTCPPLELSVTASPDVLWSPNHEMVDIDVVITTNGNTGSGILSVTSNQADNDKGDGNTDDDVDFDPVAQTVSVRAERDGRDKAGRTYTIVAWASDQCGVYAEASATVFVPHSQKP